MYTDDKHFVDLFSKIKNELILFIKRNEYYTPHALSLKKRIFFIFQLLVFFNVMFNVSRSRLRINAILLLVLLGRKVYYLRLKAHFRNALLVLTVNRSSQGRGRKSLNP